MRFISLTTSLLNADILRAEYKAGREIGIVKLGESCLFFRRRLKVYYVPYAELERCFRRVMSVPAKLCCGKGEFIIENLVIYAEGKEVAEVQLPGTKAAKILMDELKTKAPGAQFSRPEDKQDGNEGDA